MARRPQDRAQLKVRLPETLRRSIEDAARQRGWSMNDEIVIRLFRSFEKDGDAMEATAEVLAAALPPAVLHDLYQNFIGPQLGREDDAWRKRQADWWEWKQRREGKPKKGKGGELPPISFIRPEEDKK